jgi:hypothetical protein
MKKTKTLDDLEYAYRIYTPSGGHKVFRIIKINKKSQRTETIKAAELDDVNAKFVEGKLNKETARELVEKIKEKLYEKDGVKKVTSIVLPENKKLLNDYWHKTYVPKLKELEDPAATLYEFERAIEAVGAVSLKKASQNEIKKASDPL